MADSASVALSDPEEPAGARKGVVKRLLVPLLMLLIGAGGGVAGAIFLGPMLVAGGEEKPVAPKVAPLEYVEIDNSFTANLRDTGRFVQLKVAVSTQGGQPVIDAIHRHNVAIIAAVLGALADTTEQELMAPGGRDALARRMRIAINDVLQRKSGIAGIDDVFLTSFVMQ